MSRPARSPDRGDIWWLTLDPTIGHGQRGRRPVVVLSVRDYNARLGMMVCCPVTSRAKGYPFEVPLPGEAKTSGVALADQIKTVDWRERQATFIEELSPETTAEVLRYARVMLSD